MPGIGEYLALAKLGANLLALPQTINQQGQANTDIRNVLAGAGLGTGDLNAVAPQPAMQQFPGNDVPVLGSLLRGIGTGGQLLQGVLGEKPAAPRMPLGTLVALSQLTQQGRKQKALEALGGTYTNPRAKALAAAGYPGAAETAEGTKIGPAGELPQLLQGFVDQGMSQAGARQAALKEIDKRRLARAGAQATAVAGARLGGKEKGLAADVPTLQRFGAPVPSVGDAQPEVQMTPQAAPAPMNGPGVYRIADTGAIEQVNPGQPSMNPTGARLSLPGGSSVEFATPQMANEFTTMMRAQGVQPNGPPEDAQRVLDSWQQYNEDKAMAQEEAARIGKPIPEADRNAIVNLRMFQRQVARTQTDFTPQERDKFTGYFAYPARQLGQFIRADPRFAQWIALVGQVEAAKFGEGGKQLTPTEAQVVEKYIPTGWELGGRTDFDAKAQEFLTRADGLIRDRLSLATQSGEQSRLQYEKDRGQYLPQNLPQGTPKTADEWLRSIPR